VKYLQLDFCKASTVYAVEHIVLRCAVSYTTINTPLCSPLYRKCTLKSVPACSALVHAVPGCAGGAAPGPGRGGDHSVCYCTVHVLLSLCLLCSALVCLVSGCAGGAAPGAGRGLPGAAQQRARHVLCLLVSHQGTFCAFWSVPRDTCYACWSVTGSLLCLLIRSQNTYFASWSVVEQGHALVTGLLQSVQRNQGDRHMIILSGHPQGRSISCTLV